VDTSALRFELLERPRRRGHFEWTAGTRPLASASLPLAPLLALPHCHFDGMLALEWHRDHDDDEPGGGGGSSSSAQAQVGPRLYVTVQLRFGERHNSRIGESFLRVHRVAVPEATRARRVNSARELGDRQRQPARRRRRGAAPAGRAAVVSQAGAGLGGGW
jgi:hypothetical protein